MLAAAHALMQARPDSCPPAGPTNPGDEALAPLAVAADADAAGSAGPNAPGEDARADPGAAARHAGRGRQRTADSLAGDDLLPLFVWLLATARVPCLAAHLRVARDWMPAAQQSSAGAYRPGCSQRRACEYCFVLLCACVFASAAWPRRRRRR